MKNNLLNKYLFSSYLASVLFMGAAGTAFYIAEKEVQMVKNHPGNKQLKDSSKTTCFICLLIAAASVVMGVFSGVKYPMVVKAKTKNMTKNYLQDIFVRHPEMRKYSSILEDSEKIYEIAAVICNDLTDTEQKDILNYANEELSKSDNAQGVTQIKKIEYMIIDVIQAHAKKDPKYMRKILQAIANAQNPRIAEAAIQKVR